MPPSCVNGSLTKLAHAHSCVERIVPAACKDLLHKIAVDSKGKKTVVIKGIDLHSPIPCSS